MSAAPSKIRDRIRQLREKTVARGCTEAEALAAAAKAAAMMAEHGLSENDLEIEEASSILSGKRHEALAKLWAIVGLVTNTAGLTIGGARSSSVLFVGVAPGPEIAAYLRDVLDRAVATELKTFKAGAFYRRRRSTKTRRIAIADFLQGLIARLSNRLVTLFEASISADHLQIACDARDRAHPRSTSLALKDREVRYGEASNEGWRAGARPNLSHGVGGESASRLAIGRAG